MIQYDEFSKDELIKELEEKETIIDELKNKKKIDKTIKKQNKILLEMVNLDDLTKIYNRKALYGKLEEEIFISNEEKTKLSVVMMDLDRFSKVNDNHGHLSGDQVIKRTAEIIEDTILGEGFVGRYGGEEYLVVLPGSDKKQAYVIAEKIRKNIEDTDFIHGVKITISGGVREYDNKESLNTLIDRSDRNLYEAKESGRNKVVSD